MSTPGTAILLDEQGIIDGQVIRDRVVDDNDITVIGQPLFRPVVSTGVPCSTTMVALSPRVMIR